MVQRQRAADHDPGQNRRGEAGERTDGERRQDFRVRLDPAFQHDGDRGGEQLEMSAGNRQEAVCADFPGDHRHMGGRVHRALDFVEGVELFGGEQIVEPHHPVRQVVAEAADVADREDVGRDMHRQFAQIDVADPSAGDQGLGPDQRQRVDGVSLAP